MSLLFSFDNSFIYQKVYVCFHMDIHEVFKEYLESRTVEELRALERKFEEDFTGFWELRFDDYSRLVNRHNTVLVWIQYPNDEEEREDLASTEGFFELLVKYNLAYDRILIDPGKHSIGPRGRAVIENMGWVPYSLKKEPENGSVHVLFPEGCFAAFKACLENRSEEELKTIAAAARKAYDTREEDYREDLSWDDGSGICFFRRTTEAWKREARDGEEKRCAMSAWHLSDLATKLVEKYERMRKEKEEA